MISALIALALACEEEPARSPKPDGPVACTKDEECQAPPCGPCTAGAPITSDMLTQTCVVNPCPQAVAHCAADHNCAVKCVACGGAPPS